MNNTNKIYIAGHKGLVGSAILRLLQKEGYTNLVHKTRNELDLTKIFNLGWIPKVKLENGLKETYEWYVKTL